MSTKQCTVFCLTEKVKYMFLYVGRGKCVIKWWLSKRSFINICWVINYFILITLNHWAGRVLPMIWYDIFFAVILESSSSVGIFKSFSSGIWHFATFLSSPTMRNLGKTYKLSSYLPQLKWSLLISSTVRGLT